MHAPPDALYRMCKELGIVATDGLSALESLLQEGIHSSIRVTNRGIFYGEQMYSLSMKMMAFVKRFNDGAYPEISMHKRDASDSAQEVLDIQASLGRDFDEITSKFRAAGVLEKSAIKTIERYFESRGIKVSVTGKLIVREDVVVEVCRPLRAWILKWRDKPSEERK